MAQARNGTHDNPFVIDPGLVSIENGTARLILHFYSGKAYAIQWYEPELRLNDAIVISHIVRGKASPPDYIRVDDIVYMRRTVTWFDKERNILNALYTDFHDGSLKTPDFW